MQPHTEKESCQNFSLFERMLREIYSEPIALTATYGLPDGPCISPPAVKHFHRSRNHRCQGESPPSRLLDAWVFRFRLPNINELLGFALTELTRPS